MVGSRFVGEKGNYVCSAQAENLQNGHEMGWSNVNEKMEFCDFVTLRVNFYGFS